MAKQAWENVVDPKQYYIPETLGTRNWKLGEDKKFGGSNNNNSSNKIRIIRIAKIKEDLLFSSALHIFLLNSNDHSTRFHNK